MARNRDNRVKIGQKSRKRLEKRLRNGSETVRTSMDGTILMRWMYSTTIEGGTPGAPLVTHMLGSPCRGALAPENGCNTVIRTK